MRWSNQKAITTGDIIKWGYSLYASVNVGIIIRMTEFHTTIYWPNAKTAISYGTKFVKRYAEKL